jgi:hypothetical protein
VRAAKVFGCDFVDGALGVVNTKDARARWEFVRAEVERLYPSTKMEKLAACIQRGPGFLYDERCEDLASHVRRWARDHLPHPYNERRTNQYHWVLMENGASSARKEMQKLQKTAQELQQRLSGLSPAARYAFRQMSAIVATRAGHGSLVGKASDAYLQSILQSAALLEQISRLSAELAGYHVRKHRPRTHELEPAVKGLAAIWSIMTGRKPTVFVVGGVCGPFPDFVRSAIEPMWPKKVTGNMDGLIRKACREVGELGWT